MAGSLIQSAQEKLDEAIIELEEGVGQIVEQEQAITKAPEYKQETVNQTKPQTSIVINGNVDTGDDYVITNESQRIDYSTTIIIVAAIIVCPLFVLGMTILIMMHKRAEREHAEKVLWHQQGVIFRDFKL
jgi:hypothetical protein